MANFKMSGPPSITGNAEEDISNLYAYNTQLHSQLAYVLSNIDSDNLSEEFYKSINTEE